MTGPKPFPFPIGIGTDICSVNRIAAVLRHEFTRNRWARKVFTRLEWPFLCRRLRHLEKPTEIAIGRADVASDENLGHKSGVVRRYQEDTIWMLPRLPSIPEDDDSYWSVVADKGSASGSLARYLAGRWAAKEAVIKAHRHRRLYMQDISIVGTPLAPDLSSTKKLIALIDPPCDRVKIHLSVALHRCLRGFTFQNKLLHRRALMTKDELRKEPQELRKSEMDEGVHYYRRSRVKESDRQIAEINISHDGDYAIAVCMAFDPPDSIVQEKTIVDSGEGLPLHEPQWGDEGWLDLAKPGIEGGSFGVKSSMGLDMKSLLDEVKPTSNPDAFRTEFRNVFQNDNVPPLP